MLTQRVSLCATIVALVSPCLGADNAFREIAPDVAVAKPEFVEKMKEYLLHAEHAWSPTDEQVLAALSLLRSERGKQAIVEKAGSEMRIEKSLQRLDKSRYQVFGVVIKGRRHLFVDATPLDSDAPEWWLTDCISRNVFDGGAAYWWVLVRAEPLTVVDCNRRPDV